MNRMACCLLEPAVFSNCIMGDHTGGAVAGPEVPRSPIPISSRRLRDPEDHQRSTLVPSAGWVSVAAVGFAGAIPLCGALASLLNSL